jgi:hypothetical protein
MSCSRQLQAIFIFILFALSPTHGAPCSLAMAPLDADLDKLEFAELREVESLVEKHLQNCPHSAQRALEDLSKKRRILLDDHYLRVILDTSRSVVQHKLDVEVAMLQYDGITRRVTDGCNFCPFHLDAYLLQAAAVVAPTADCFFEVGTKGGASLRLVRLLNPELAHSLSCDESLVNVKTAGELARGARAVVADGRECLFGHVKPLMRSCRSPLFSFDGHGYNGPLPLMAEYEFVAASMLNGWILIDDFNVGPPFMYNSAANDDFLAERFIDKSSARTFCFVRPAYTSSTSPCHGLVGWILIGVGSACSNPVVTEKMQQLPVLFNVMQL